MSERVYKVVKNYSNRLYSYVKFTKHPIPCEVEYSTEFWSYPVFRGSKLFVFRDLNEARSMIRNSDFKAELWVVEACDLEKAPNSRFATIDEENYEDYWKNKEEYSCEFTNEFWLASKVRLIERIV